MKVIKYNYAIGCICNNKFASYSHKHKQLPKKRLYFI